MSGIDKHLYYRMEDLCLAADHLVGVAGYLLKKIEAPQVRAMAYRAKVNFSSTARVLEKIVKEVIVDAN